MSQPRSNSRSSSSSGKNFPKSAHNAYDENKFAEIEGRLLAKMENIITAAQSVQLGELKEAVIELKGTFNSLNTSIDDIKSRVEILESSQGEIGEMKSDLLELDNSFKTIRNRVETLASSQACSLDLEARVRELESELRKSHSHRADLESMIRGNNIVVYGIVEEKGEAIFTVVKNFLKHTLKLEDFFVEHLVLGDALRMGNIKPAMHRPVKVKFTRREDKRVVFGKYLDSRSEHIKAGVRIRDDLSVEIRKFRAEVYPLFERLMEKGEKPKFEGNSVVCGKKVFTDVDKFKAFVNDILASST